VNAADRQCFCSGAVNVSDVFYKQGGSAQKRPVGSILEHVKEEGGPA